MTRVRQASQRDVAEVGAVGGDRAAGRVVEAAQELGQRRLAGAVLADDGQRGAGRDREVETGEHRGTLGVAERDALEPDRGASAAARRRVVRATGRRLRQAARRAHRLLQPADGGDRRGRTVERPVEPTEGDRADADGGLQRDDRRSQVEAAVGGLGAERPERGDVGHRHDEQAHGDRPLAQPRRLVLQVVEPAPVGAEAVDDPVGEPEQPDLLGRRGVDGQAVRVLGVALGVLDLWRVAVAPDGALAQQPVGGRPRQDEHQRLPPAVEREHDGRGGAGDEADQPVGDEVHGIRQGRTHDAEIEVAGHREVGRQVGPFEMGDPRWLERRRHQAVVERRRRPVTEVVAERLVQWSGDLGSDEHDAQRDERRGEGTAIGDGADQPAGGDSDHRRQHAAQQETDAPQHGQSTVGAHECPGERPLLARPQPGVHAGWSSTGPHACSPPTGSA